MFAWQAFLMIELAPHPLNQFSKTVTLDSKGLRSVCDGLPIQLWDSPAAFPALSQQPLWSSETPPARSHALSNSRTPGSKLVPKGSSRVLAVTSGFPTFTGLGTLSSLGRDKENKAGGPVLIVLTLGQSPALFPAAGPPPTSAERAELSTN